MRPSGDFHTSEGDDGQQTSVRPTVQLRCDWEAHSVWRRVETIASFSNWFSPAFVLDRSISYDIPSNPVHMHATFEEHPSRIVEAGVCLAFCVANATALQLGKMGTWSRGKPTYSRGGPISSDAFSTPARPLD